MLIDFVPENPFRPLHWRWQLASCLRQISLRPRRRRWIDPWVRTAMKYQERLDARRARPLIAHTTIAEAHDIWSCSTKLRLEIECRLLARQRYGEIATLCGRGAAVIEAYEGLFYNVRERLNCVDYISLVIDPASDFPCGLSHNREMLRLLAYKYGPVAVDLLNDLLDGRELSQIDTPLAHAVQRLVTVLRLPVDEETAPTWVRVNSIITQLEQLEMGDSAAPLSKPLLVRFDPPAAFPSGTQLESDGRHGRSQTTVVHAPDLDRPGSRLMPERSANQRNSRRVAVE